MAMKLARPPCFIIVALLVAVAGAFAHKAYAEVQAPDIFNEAWDIACAISEYSCDGVDAPEVKLMWHHAYLGGFNGDGTVHINLFFPRTRLALMSTTIHEMLHYISYWSGPYNDYTSQRDICDSENYSYTKVNEWLETINRADLQIHNWWEDQPGHRGYWKCLPWYPGFKDFVIGEPEFGK